MMTFVNGALPKLTERAFMAQVLKYAKLMQWRWYHTYRSDKSEEGFPDLVLIRRPRVLFVEIKAQRTKATDAQLAWLIELRECGQEVFLWRPSDWQKIERILR